MCMYTLNKCDSNICQMRLEFENVMLSDPSMGDCTNDTLMISDVDAQSQKVIPMSLCGTLTGQHMVVNVKGQTGGSKIVFNIVSAASMAKWRVKVVQLSCSDPDLLAPPGCLTYNTAESGTIQSYNYQGGNGELINNQKFSHCIKYMEGFCDVALTSMTFDMGANGDAGDSLTYGPVKFQFRDPADPNIFPVCTLPPNVSESPASPAVPMSKVIEVRATSQKPSMYFMQ